MDWTPGSQHSRAESRTNLAGIFMSGRGFFAGVSNETLRFDAVQRERSMADSKADDDIGFLDRNAGRILLWSQAISWALELIGYLLTPSDEQMEDARKDDDLFASMVMLGGLVWLINIIAGLVSFTGKVLAFVGYTQRGRDRDRRRRAEQQSQG